VSGGRTREQRIVDPATHPRSSVCLAVAAEFLGIDKRTLRKRIDLGQIAAWRDEKVYRINIADIVAYQASKQLAS
jgi:excisionase family DNA binding protein